MPKQAISHVHYIRDNYNGAYRIWRSQDPGDVFDMIPIAEFEPYVLKFVQALGGLFVEGFPEDDAGELTCPLCKANASLVNADKPRLVSSVKFPRHRNGT